MHVDAKAGHELLINGTGFLIFSFKETVDNRFLDGTRSEGSSQCRSRTSSLEQT
jgi:hypothetical protein